MLVELAATRLIPQVILDIYHRLLDIFGRHISNFGSQIDVWVTYGTGFHIKELIQIYQLTLGVMMNAQAIVNI